MLNCECLTIKVVLNDDFKMGVNWHYINSALDSLNIKGIFNVLAIGQTGVTLTAGNLNDDNYSVMIEALSTTGETNLLSSPRIMAIEGEQAKILVGENVSYKTIDTREDAGGVLRTFEKVVYIEVGVNLFVTPHVNDDGTVVMNVRQEVSSVIGYRDGVPQIRKSESETKVAVPNGVTAVMAGLIRDESIVVKNKVPILGSIPLLGFLFRSTDSQKIKAELIVFLTPHITMGEATPEELEKLEPFEGD